MRSASYGLVGLAIIVGILGLVNHYFIHANPVDHTSTVIGGVAVVLLVIGGAMMLMGRSSAS
jgi:predicted tellurium resistance membrane protein TerC